jgi:hypothetical protein
MATAVHKVPMRSRSHVEILAKRRRDAVFAAFGRSAVRERFAGRALVVVAALFASLAMTAAYHLGYSDFRSGKVRSPVTSPGAFPRSSRSTRSEPRLHMSAST